jgi:hypothetical protein
VETENPYAAPRHSAPKVAELPPGQTAWRKGNMLVVDHEAELPARCVKCGFVTDDRPKKLTLVWYPSWTLIGLLFCGLPFIILALILQKRATIHVHICERHRARRLYAIQFGWLGALTGIVMIVAGVILKHELAPLLCLGGLVLLFVSIIGGIILSRLFSPQRIVKRRAWLKGACPEFLAVLPEYPL